MPRVFYDFGWEEKAAREAAEACRPGFSAFRREALCWA